MLEYCKLILEKVSFNPGLFEKELRKSMQYLDPEEMQQLMNWAQVNFAEKYSEVLNVIELFLRK